MTEAVEGKEWLPDLAISITAKGVGIRLLGRSKIRYV
jgi:hypothetical protein